MILVRYWFSEDQLTQSNPFCTSIISSFHITRAHYDDIIVGIQEKSTECLIKKMKTDQPIFSRNWYYYLIVNKQDFSDDELIWLHSWKSYLITFLKSAKNSSVFFILIDIYFPFFVMSDSNLELSQYFVLGPELYNQSQYFVLGLKLYVYRYFFRFELSVTLFWFPTRFLAVD